MLTYPCTNNAHRFPVTAWGALSTTATFYSSTYIVLYTHSCKLAVGSTIAQRACDAIRIINRLSYNQPCWCQLDRNCDYHTSTTTKVVDGTAYSCASTPSWTQTFVVDGHKFLAVRRMSRRLLDRWKKAVLPTPPAFGAIGVIQSEFCKDLLRHKLESLGYRAALFLIPMFSRFDKMPACGRRTDRQTDMGW